MQHDEVDAIVSGWQRERPDLPLARAEAYFRLTRLGRAFSRRVDQTGERFELDEGLFGVLAVLRRSGPPYQRTQFELWNAVLTSSSVMTKRIDRLVVLGLVERSADPNKRRGVTVGLTDKGLQVINDVVGAYFATADELMSRLSAEDFHTLTAILRRLSDSAAPLLRDDAAQAGVAHV